MKRWIMIGCLLVIIAVIAIFAIRPGIITYTIAFVISGVLAGAIGYYGIIKDENNSL